MQIQKERKKLKRLKRLTKSTWQKLFLLSFLLTVLISGLSSARRLGINAGVYREGLNLNNSGSREVGLRLGLYFDRTVHDQIGTEIENNRNYVNSSSQEAFGQRRACRKLEPIVRQRAFSAVPQAMAAPPAPVGVLPMSMPIPIPIPVALPVPAPYYYNYYAAPPVLAPAISMPMSMSMPLAMPLSSTTTTPLLSAPLRSTPVAMKNRAVSAFTLMSH